MSEEHLSDAAVEEVRQRVRARGFAPSTPVVRAVMETFHDGYLAGGGGAVTDLAEHILALHPVTVVRRQLASGVEVDAPFCEWCGVPAPCPDRLAVQEVMPGVPV